jgi:hypothetical protein
MACSDMINQLLNDIDSTSKIAQNLQLQLQTGLKLQKKKIDDEYESMIQLVNYCYYLKVLFSACYKTN